MPAGGQLEDLRAAWRGEYVDPDVFPRADLVPVGAEVDLPEAPWRFVVREIDRDPGDPEMVILVGDRAKGETYRVAEDWPVSRVSPALDALWGRLAAEELACRGGEESPEGGPVR